MNKINASEKACATHRILYPVKKERRETELGHIGSAKRPFPSTKFSIPGRAPRAPF